METHLGVLPETPNNLTSVEHNAYISSHAQNIYTSEQAFAHVSQTIFSFIFRIAEGYFKSTAGRYRNTNVWDMVIQILFLGRIPFLPGPWGIQLLHGTIPMEVVSMAIVAVSALQLDKHPVIKPSGTDSSSGRKSTKKSNFTLECSEHNPIEPQPSTPHGSDH